MAGTQRKNAEAHKLDGNKMFQAKRYKEAAESYSNAILMNPLVATYYTNRALCHIYLSQWSKVGDDCQRAIDLEKKNIKAYYFWGRAQIQLESYDQAISLLTMANEFSSQAPQGGFGDEITSQLRMARREKFRREEDKRIHQEIGLVTYVERLIEEDAARRIAKLKDMDVSEQMEQIQISGSENTGPEEIRINDECQNYKNELSQLLAQVDERRRRRELPDYLCGKISFELLRDPVITPDGITYDRADITQHLRKVGHFDPVTRSTLTENQLIPNLAMKEVVEAFVQENPWAEHDDII